ncbi:hypothetical protein ACP4OV_022807 [Aristida adscensionis]
MAAAALARAFRAGCSGRSGASPPLLEAICRRKPQESVLPHLPATAAAHVHTGPSVPRRMAFSTSQSGIKGGAIGALKSKYVYVYGLFESIQSKYAILHVAQNLETIDHNVSSYQEHLIYGSLVALVPMIFGGWILYLAREQEANSEALSTLKKGIEKERLIAEINERALRELEDSYEDECKGAR